MKLLPAVLCFTLGLSLTPAAWAESQRAPATNPATALADATVKGVDKAQGKLTLRHGPLANLDMPAMTMAFRVQDAKWLDRVRAGDAVRFRAENLNGVLTVTRLELVR